MSIRDFRDRFARLAEEGANILASARHRRTPGIEGIEIDNQAYLKWKVNASHLISMICGEKSQHFIRFIQTEDVSMYRGYHDCLKDGLAVFAAARDDFEGGFLVSMRSLIEAELFDDELEQAEALLSAGYYPAAAVTAGAVIETTLRRMCADAGLSTGNLNALNTELGKAGVYNKLVVKTVTAWADVRNNAAHGHANQFKREDVAAMIAGVRRFVTERLSVA